MYFTKKNKKNKEDVRRENAQKINDTILSLKIKIAQLDDKKERLLIRIMNEKMAKSTNSEQETRALLKRVLKQNEMLTSQLYHLENFLDSEDIIQIGVDYINCMNNISDSIIKMTNETNGKEIKKVADKASYALYKANRHIGSQLDMSNALNEFNNEIDDSNEYDEEIDKMLNDMNDTTMSTRQSKITTKI